MNGLGLWVLFCAFMQDDQVDKNSSFLNGLNNSKLHFQFNNIRELWKKMGKEWEVEDWDGIRQIVCNYVAAVINDPKTPAPVVACYQKLDYLQGLHRIALVCGEGGTEAEVKNLKFSNLLPSNEILSALKKANENKKPKKPLSTYIPGDAGNAMNIVVMGAAGVGKSAIIVRFVQDVFVTKYSPTIEDSYSKQVYFDNQCTMLTIVDTAGLDEHAALRESYIKAAEGFFLVYSATDRGSFDALRELRNLIVAKQQTENVPMVVVANKSDLEDTVVSSELGAALASEWNAPFFETSAKTRQNIDQPFRALLREFWVRDY